MILYFILGMLFIYIFIPLVDNLLSIISTQTQYINFKYAAKCVKLKKEYGIEVEEEEQSSNPIGFVFTDAIGTSEEPEVQTEEEDENEE